MFLSSGEGNEAPNSVVALCKSQPELLDSTTVQWLKLAPSKWLNKLGVSLSSPEDGKKSSFRNVVFSSHLEFRTLYKSTDTQ
jgi:hypothetical protein